jgi:hypothetical protein
MAPFCKDHSTALRNDNRQQFQLNVQLAVAANIAPPMLLFWHYGVLLEHKPTLMPIAAPNSYRPEWA